MSRVLIALAGGLEAPCTELDGATPLQVARTPALDALARQGTVTRLAGLPPDPGAALFELLGYPAGGYPGEGPLEALSLGVPLSPRDLALRACLTVAGEDALVAVRPDSLSPADAATLLALLSERLSSRLATLFPAAFGRGALRLADTGGMPHCLTPEAALGRPWEQALPVGDGDERLRAWFWDSRELLEDHPINRRRRSDGLPPANALWCFAPGRRPTLRSLLLECGCVATLVSADPVALGLGVAIGVDTALPTPSGVQAVMGALDDGAELVVLTIAAPAPADPDQRIARWEALEARLIAPLIERLERRDDPFRIAVVAGLGGGGDCLALGYDAARRREEWLPFDERSLAETRAPRRGAPGFLARLLERPGA